MAYTVTRQYQTVSSTNSFYLSYLCSHCLNPVIKLITLSSKETGKAGLILRDDPNQLSQQAGQVNQAWSKQFLDYMQNPAQGQYPVTDNENQKILGFDTPCPICGSKEPWQSKNQLYRINLSFPVNIYNKLSFPFENAKAQLRTRLEEAQSTLADQTKMNEARQSIEEASQKVKALQNEAENGPIATYVKNLRFQKEQLNARLSETGAFSKDKKTLKEQLKACEDALSVGEERYKSYRASLDVEIAQAQQKCVSTQFPVRQYSGKAVLFEKDTTIALILAESNEPIQSGEIISLQPLPKLKAVYPSPHEKENIDRVQQLVKEIGPGMEEA